MKSRTVACLVVSAAAFVGGCDFFGGGEAKKVEMIKLEEQKAERVATEKKDAAAAMRAYIAGKCALVSNDAVRVASALAVPVKDAQILEKALAATMNDTNASSRVEHRLAAALINPTVDELAHKYLSAGFSVQRETFLARVAAAEREERVYREALAKTDRAFETRVAGTTQWQTNTKDTHSGEIKRIENDIKRLESSLHSVRNGLNGTNFDRTKRKEKINEIEGQLKDKRRELERLRNPRNRQNDENRVVAEQVNTRDRARAVRESEKREIERRLKPKTDLMKVVEETEKQTLGVLRAKIQKEKERLSADLASREKKVRLAQEYLLEVGVCDETGLKQLRARVDANLSYEAGKR